MENLGIGLIAFLVFFPMLIALFMLVGRNNGLRSFFTIFGAIFIAAGSIVAACVFIPQGAQKFAVNADFAGVGISHIITIGALVVDVILGLYVIVKAAMYKKWFVAILALAQIALVLWFDLTCAKDIEVSNALYIDNFSIIMALIIGVVGSAIAVYSLGYMKDHHDGRHPDVKDRRPTFFAVMFAFLGAMFAIVFANNLSWMFCAWEITTVCSFALIGYDKNEVSIKNSFHQIMLNLIGGLAFALALVWVAKTYQVLELDQFITQTVEILTNTTSYSLVAYVPILLFSLAAFTKAAQFPFQSWLLGAMVAPTPTSALLHSSTMVKAGVFLLIKLAPCFGMTLPGYCVMTVGIATFLFASIAAISQTNAKRVLAYSTIGNLGLIVACAGVGTDGAVWAGIFLIIFHAVAKSLLFLAVGSAEHQIGSRDIEDMDLLFERMPRLARLMCIGIMGMFIAPFGMLVSKWAALAAFTDSSNVVLILVLVFGSAATFMFWAKWLGKLLAIAHGGSLCKRSKGGKKKALDKGADKGMANTTGALDATGGAAGAGADGAEGAAGAGTDGVAGATAATTGAAAASGTASASVYDENGEVINLEKGVHSSEWMPLNLLALLTVACCIVFPFVSDCVVQPYLSTVFNNPSADVSAGNLWIMAVIAFVVAVIFLGFSGKTKKKIVPAYMAGVGISDTTRTFKNSFGAPVAATQRNWYMNEVFPEKKVSKIGVTVTLVILILVFGFVGQTLVQSKAVVQNYTTEHAAYKGGTWESEGIDYSTFDQYYQQYISYYTQSKDQYQSYGIETEGAFMDYLYEQLSQQANSSSSSESTDTSGSTDATGETSSGEASSATASEATTSEASGTSADASGSTSSAASSADTSTASGTASTSSATSGATSTSATQDSSAQGGN